MNKPTDATLTAILAGTPEAGTELPPNSRPSHDAGMKPMSSDDAERVATLQTAKPLKPEGSENRQHGGNASGNKNR
jgi:hypothetical protein